MNGRPFGLPFVAFSALLVSALWACAGDSGGRLGAGDVPFKRLEQGETYTADLAVPAVFVARSADEVGRFRSLVEGADRLTTRVNFGESLVVAVFRGQAPSGGHRISVTSIRAGGREVRVAVELTGPPDAAPDVLAYPYEVVAVPKGAVPASARWLLVGPDGAVIAETDDGG